MKQNKKNGFVVSAVLYPLLILFLALIMGLLSMSDTRKRILDKMKLEISDSVFDEATCSCDTILNKLNYLIKNGVGGGGGGSYTHNVLGLNITAYEIEGDLPGVGNNIGDIAVITTTEISSYYVSHTKPNFPTEGTVWVVQDVNAGYFIESDYSRIGINYVMQFEGGKWILKQGFVYSDNNWKRLYFVNIKDGTVDLTGSDVNAVAKTTFNYTGKYQTFIAPFSGYYNIEAYGAQGASYNATYQGGKGAYTAGEIYLEVGEVLYVYVGGAGSNTNSSNSFAGGWNGGGNGWTYVNGYGNGGGGATDIRTVATTSDTAWNEFASLKSRIMVAAGGGGSGYYASGTQYYYGTGAAGGTLNGNSGTSTYSNSEAGTGGDQMKAGTNGDRTGGFGYGGTSISNSGVAGGGSGYYGGGGSARGLAGGGSGSSYISGYEGVSSIDETSTGGNIIHNGSPYHYSGYYFKNASMKAGENSGNGKVVISLVTVELLSDEEIQTVVKDDLIYNYYYNGQYQLFTVPKTGTYQVDMWGAQGASYNTTYQGGKGAYTTGKIYLTKGTTYYIYVGGQGSTYTGGWNGGGSGGNAASSPGYGGGGATDMRIMSGSDITLANPNTTVWNEFNSLKSRIMVAAGGGGAGYYQSGTQYYYGSGGAGGTLEGRQGSSTYQIYETGVGGLQYKAGYLTSNSLVNNGGFGYGGTNNSNSCGGGSGYYGGGGSNRGLAGGGGGSSYISGYEGCNSIDEDSTSSNIIHNYTSKHYSGHYFQDGNMSENVRSGNGFAQIKYINDTQTVEPTEDYNYEFKYNSTNLSSSTPYKITIQKTGTYEIELWGAQGVSYNSTYSGGKGAYTSGTINLSAGTTLYVFVGGQGSNYTGGWNGGGSGGNAASSPGYGGGGATDIRLVENSTPSRIMVAAGGGGAGYFQSGTQYYYGTGGAAGGLNGYQGSSTYQISETATGGTQLIGGGLVSNPLLNIGGFGNGGTNGTNSSAGGAGYYGGGGSNRGLAGGGGGSSYISGHTGCIAIKSATNTDPVTTEATTNINDSIHYSGYKFSNTVMIDGQGYVWTYEKAASALSMPTYDGKGTMIGNTGNGYAKITYLGY